MSDVLVVVMYDVNTETKDGKRRLRKVAKAWERYGQRVQMSVFECDVDPAQLQELKHRLVGIVDKEKDALRYYNLGSNYRNRIEYYGKSDGYYDAQESTLVL